MSPDYSLLKIVLIFTLLWVPINDAMARDSYIENCLRSAKPDGHCLRMQRNLKRWEDSIEIAANKVGIEAALLKAVVAVESHFNANAQSNSGPVGLTQILPSTARTLGFSKDQLKFPEVNLEAGALYLKVQLTQFGNQDLAVIAYNLGGKTQTLNKKSQRHANLYANEVMSIYEYFKAREKILEQSNTN